MMMSIIQPWGIPLPSPLSVGITSDLWRCLAASGDKLPPPSDDYRMSKCICHASKPPRERRREDSITAVVLADDEASKKYRSDYQTITIGFVRLTSISGLAAPPHVSSSVDRPYINNPEPRAKLLNFQGRYSLLSKVATSHIKIKQLTKGGVDAPGDIDDRSVNPGQRTGNITVGECHCRVFQRAADNEAQSSCSKRLKPRRQMRPEKIGTCGVDATGGLHTEQSQVVTPRRQWNIDSSPFSVIAVDSEWEHRRERLWDRFCFCLYKATSAHQNSLYLLISVLVSSPTAKSISLIALVNSLRVMDSESTTYVRILK
ncbi:hypothetical protein J6590_058757 [Homalodisca vitripennis]|nr:hypothetical protein J6590_058757 [Homalodisca vitripennis]